MILVVGCILIPFFYGVVEDQVIAVGEPFCKCSNLLTFYRCNKNCRKERQFWLIGVWNLKMNSKWLGEENVCNLAGIKM